MQQAYGTSSPSSYMNTSFYNSSSYGYAAAAAASLSTANSTSPTGNLSSRGTSLNPACKASAAGYLSGYTAPTSPFGSAGSVTGTTHQSGTYGSTYSGYNCAAGTSGFAQAFPAQVNYYSYYFFTNFFIHFFYSLRL